MATKYYCDECGTETRDIIPVEVPDGVHPHNGDEMTKLQDMCMSCLKKEYAYLIPGRKATKGQ